MTNCLNLYYVRNVIAAPVVDMTIDGVSVSLGVSQLFRKETDRKRATPYSLEGVP